MQFKAAISLAGVQMMIINDHKQVFYPILQVKVEQLTLAVENKPAGLRADTDIKMMISYYNNSLDLWEPFLERTHLRLSAEQDDYQSQVYAGFRAPVSLNFSEELIENVLPAYLAFEKAKKLEASTQHRQHAMTVQRSACLPELGDSVTSNSQALKTQARAPLGQPTLLHRQSEVLTTTQLQRPSHRGNAAQPFQQPGAGRGKSQPQEVVRRRNLEFKVAPYRIVNLTSKKLMIRRCEIDSALTGRGARGDADGHGHSRGFSTFGGGAKVASRYGQQSRQGPQGSSSKGKSGRFQNNLTRHPILQQSSSRNENSPGEAATGHGQEQ